MSDIRSFFQPKGGAASASAKPPLQKHKPSDDKSRRSSRRVVEDSDDDEPPAPEKPPPAKRTKNEEKNKLKGIEMTASDYFASAKPSKTAKTVTPKKAHRPAPVLVESSPLRISPRIAAKRNAVPPVKETAQSRKPPPTYKKFDIDDDGDLHMQDGDDGDDIFMAGVKGGGKRGDDDYEEDEGEEDIPMPTRVTARGQNGKGLDELTPETASASKKRKSPEQEQESESEEKVPRKKSAASKPRKPRMAKAKKAEEPEDQQIQDILDNVPLVRPPTPPPKDPNAKFDWKKANGGGGGAPSNPGGAEIPEGAEECLAGMTFVFTGVLQTIGRDEAQALAKKYGGKVTGQPSSKTTFVVLGDDAGPSKLAKIKQMGIKTINEDGLFDLIRRLPAHGGSGKGAQQAQEKKKAEEEKVRKQAAEMEAEEKARRLDDEKAARRAAAARGVAIAPAAQIPPSQLWTSKYAPTQLNQICGNKTQVERIRSWLREWPKMKRYNFQKRGQDGMGGSRAIIISGSPGIGKTTSAHLAAKLEGYDVIESNASDSRSKKLVESGLGDVMNNTSLLGFFAGDGKKVDQDKKKIVLVMDEVDGMSAGDRGGVGALAKFCKKTEVPLILICNERNLPKMKPFNFVAFDIKFQRPTLDQVRSRMMTICHREGIKLSPQAVDALIEGSNRDIRQIINMISTAKLDQASMDVDQSKAMSKSWEKHIILKPWDICHKMLAGGLFAPASKATLNDKIELYFNDHEFSFLMIQENYLRTKPMALNGQGFDKKREKLKVLELFDAAAESISDGDLVDRMIHGTQQHWSLMPTHAIFSTVRPASFVAGQLLGTGFTSLLGNMSKQGKLSRFVREIHSHMRLKSSGDYNEIRQDYLPVLWHQVIERLSEKGEGKGAVSDIIDVMDSYYLTREDFDAMLELGVGHQDQESVSFSTQTKAAFTRTYNAASHPVPFMKASNIMVPKGKSASKDAPDLEEAIEEDDDPEAIEANDGNEIDEEDELDLKKDKYIKQPKAKKGTKKDTNPEDNEDAESTTKKSKGRSKGASAKKGKGK